MRHLIQSAISLALISAVGYAAAAATTTTAPLVRTYEFTQIKQIVSNDPGCKAVYKSLKKLDDQPITFQFNQGSSASNYNVSDNTGMFQNHSYNVISQQVNGAVVDRIGMGNFTLNNQNIAYVVDTAADTSDSQFKYRFPIIFSAINAHCYYTAVLKPDANTSAAIKQTMAARASQTGSGS